MQIIETAEMRAFRLAMQDTLRQQAETILSMQARIEAIDDLDARDTSRLRFVPSQELEQPAPETEAVVTLKLTVPVSVARRMLLLVP